MLSCVIVSLTITLPPALATNCEQPCAPANTGLSEPPDTIVRSITIEKALDELRARFPNRIVVGFEELFDQRPGTEPQVDLGPEGSSLDDVLNNLRKIAPGYRIEQLHGGMVHVYSARQTADPAGLLDIRLKEFSTPQDSCIEQAIGYIDERGYAPELTKFLGLHKERWYSSHYRQLPGVIGDILGDCFGAASPGPVYLNVTVSQALNKMAERSLQVSRGEVIPNSPIHSPYKPISWRFRFRRDPDADTGLGGIPVFQTF